MRYILSFFLILFAALANAQEGKDFKVFAFPITDYIVNANDSVSVVQVIPGDGINIPKDKVGLLRSLWATPDTGTVLLGQGKCSLIKGDYYYFGIKRNSNTRVPQKGDLLYTLIDAPNLYDGLFYNIAKHSITLQRVSEEDFYSLNDIFWLDSGKEKSLIDSLVADIHYTGKTMAQQNDNQGQVVKGGRFDGKNLFAAMQNIHDTDIKDFLKFVAARPVKYAGNHWKISEIFATWMINKTPTVVE